MHGLLLREESVFPFRIGGAKGQQPDQKRLSLVAVRYICVIGKLSNCNFSH